MDRKAAWRRFDTKGPLFVLLPDCDLYRDQHPVDSCQLAISPVGGYRILETQNPPIHEWIRENLTHLQAVLLLKDSGGSLPGKLLRSELHRPSENLRAPPIELRFE